MRCEHRQRTRARPTAAGVIAAGLVLLASSAAHPSATPPRASARARESRAPLGTAGTIAAPALQQVLRRESRRVRQCYETALRRAPALAGRVELELTISAQGAVTAARIATSTLHDAAMEQCLQRVFIGVLFPAPDGGAATIRVPLVFALP